MPRHPSPASVAIRSVACPLCGAKPGQRCVPARPLASWSAGQPVADHKARRDAAAASHGEHPRIAQESPAPATCQDFHLRNLDRHARDKLRNAFRNAGFWEVRVMDDGQCIGAIISPADAEILREAKARLAEREQL